MNKKTICIVAVITAIIAVCCVIEPCIILLVGAGAYGFYKLYNYNKEQSFLTANQLYAEREKLAGNVYNAAVRVLSKIADNIDIVAPRTISDIYNEPYIIEKQGLPFIRTRVRLKPNNPQDITTLPAVKRMIQITLNQGLACGDYDDLFDVRSFNNHDPILVVENVFFEDGYLVIDWAVLNNESMYNYICNSQKVINISTPSRNDEDF